MPHKGAGGQPRKQTADFQSQYPSNSILWGSHDIDGVRIGKNQFTLPTQNPADITDDLRQSAQKFSFNTAVLIPGDINAQFVPQGYSPSQIDTCRARTGHIKRNLWFKGLRTALFIENGQFHILGAHRCLRQECIVYCQEEWQVTLHEKWRHNNGTRLELGGLPCWGCSYKE